MITKGIIKKLPNELNSNKYSVLIPYFQKAGADYTEDSISTQIRDATCCNTPGIENGLHVDDIVFVSFEDNKFDKPVIIGKLFIKNVSKSPADISGNSLYIDNGVTLNGPITINGIDFTDVEKSIRKLLNAPKEEIDEATSTVKTVVRSMSSSGWVTGTSGYYYREYSYTELGIDDFADTNCYVTLQPAYETYITLSNVNMSLNITFMKNWDSWIKNDVFVLYADSTNKRIQICAWNAPPSTAMRIKIKIIK